MSEGRSAAGGEEAIVSVQGLHKAFRIGFLMRRVVAVREATFSVRRNEIYGIVGPNGAGKTTTIKMLLGLISPDGGTATIAGLPVSRRAARERVAYLPETPHFYDYLKPAELLDYFGDLYGMDRTTKRKRIPQLIERVGLARAVDKPLRKFSKGMLQRIGLAQAMLPQSDLIILDEPQSGLDPIGRKDVRDLILEERDAGRTIIMCSHVLPDVEQICDRVAIMHLGRVVKEGRLGELIGDDRAATEVVLRLEGEPDDALAARADSFARAPGGLWRFTLAPERESDGFVRAALDAGASLVSVGRTARNLEDVFTEQALRTDAPEDDR